MTDQATPTEPAVEKIISKVQWLVSDNIEQLTCRYNDQTNTLNITGDGFYSAEVLFYESTGQVQKQIIWDHEGNIYTQQEYDEEGRLFYELDEYGYRKFYEYDGKLLVRENIYQEGNQPYGIKTWVYDDAGREVRYSEETENGEASQNIRRSYDEEGNLIFYRLDSTYGDNAWYQEETYTYTDNRLTASAHAGDDPSACWDYSMIYYYDDLGRNVGALRQDANYGDAEDAFVYDDSGRLVRSAEHYLMDGWVEVLNEYTYDDAGNLVREHYKESYASDGELFFWHTTVNTYNDAGQLINSITTDSDETTYAHYYKYDTQGNMTRHRNLIDGEEVSLQTFTYDQTGRLVQINRDGKEVLKGDDILLISGEDHADFYMTAEYTNTANVTEATAVNAFILQYIREFC